MQASLNNWRGSPRKFVKYLRAIKTFKAIDAAKRLKFMPSPYAEVLSKLIMSAVANATQDPAILPVNLAFKEASVGRAVFFKRVCFRGRGRTGRVTKFGSNVRIVLKDISAEQVLKKAKEATDKRFEQSKNQETKVLEKGVKDGQ